MDSREQLIRELARERDDFREQVRTLTAERDAALTAAKKLRVELWGVAGNIDVSTIRPGKRNDERWGKLRTDAYALLETTRWLLDGVVKAARS